MTRGQMHMRAKIAATIAIGVTIAVTQAVPSFADPSDNWVAMENWKNLMVLGLQSPRDANGANVIQWTRSVRPGTSEPTYDQQWLPSQNAEGYWSFRNAGTTDWKALTVNGNNSNNGERIISWPYKSTNHYQQWRRENNPAWPGHYRFINRGSGLCLAISGGGSNALGAQSVQWSCGTGPDQAWSLPNT
ncbi:RICIN domain-containing protein [Actinoplanes sp. NPDC020271]|uniref:RICIN domain-containing protein n=1 Tax=Actinoplanes sp. NPDC020271 TaxID=3363896 RepID=UPI0037BDAC34